jgi:hypothetical protein
LTGQLSRLPRRSAQLAKPRGQTILGIVAAVLVVIIVAGRLGRGQLLASLRPKAKTPPAPEQRARLLRPLVPLAAALVGAALLAIVLIASRHGQGFTTIAPVAAMIGAAWLLAGGLLGFHFGIPRTLQGAGIGSPTPEVQYQANTNSNRTLTG